MIKQAIAVILSLLSGAMLIPPALAQDGLPLRTPKPTFYGVGQIGHSIVPASVIQAAGLVRQADVLRKAGNLDAAQKLYCEAIAVAPLVDAYFHYADILATKGNPAKATEICRYVMSPLPKTPENQGALQPIPLFRLALYLSEAGKTQEALRVYQFAAFNNSSYDGSLSKLEFINKQGFDSVLFTAACHLGSGFALANCSDPDYPTAVPTGRKEIVEATHIKPDWAKSWLALASEMEKEVSENYGSTPKRISDNIQLGREAAIHYLELAKRPNSGETPLDIEIVESWRDRWFNPVWTQSRGN
jgi:tetratricopeptide (TPR) repeat protein